MAASLRGQERCVYRGSRSVRVARGLCCCAFAIALASVTVSGYALLVAVGSQGRENTKRFSTVSRITGRAVFLSLLLCALCLCTAPMIATWLLCLPHAGSIVLSVRVLHRWHRYARLKGTMDRVFTQLKQHNFTRLCADKGRRLLMSRWMDR